jgi:hypothetical protein
MRQQNDDYQDRQNQGVSQNPRQRQSLCGQRCRKEDCAELEDQ